MQSNSTLKQHVSQLEEALAGRESTLVDMQTQMTQALKEKELEAHQNIKRVQTLEEGLQKEKDGQREMKKQVLYTARIFGEKMYMIYRPPALSQTRLSRKPHLCRIDPSLPSLSPMLLYFNLACDELGYDENSVVSK